VCEVVGTWLQAPAGFWAGTAPRHQIAALVARGEWRSDLDAAAGPQMLPPKPAVSLRYDFDFTPIRSDPRFQELMKEPEAWAKAQPDPVDM
jgi:hypothetical protein